MRKWDCYVDRLLTMTNKTGGEMLSRSTGRSGPGALIDFAADGVLQSNDSRIPHANLAGAWVNQAERAAKFVADRLYRTRIMPAQGQYVSS
jgi:hypothetical protein